MEGWKKCHCLFVCPTPKHPRSRDVQVDGGRGGWALVVGGDLSCQRRPCSGRWSRSPGCEPAPHPSPAAPSPGTSPCPSAGSAPPAGSQHCWANTEGTLREHWGNTEGTLKEHWPALGVSPAPPWWSRSPSWELQSPASSASHLHT